MFNAAASRMVGKPTNEVLGRDDTAMTFGERNPARAGGAAQPYSLAAEPGCRNQPAIVSYVGRAPPAKD
jgi:hypothetical protein